MYDQFDNTQRFADAVKRIVLETPTAPDLHKAATSAINAFERFPWHPDKMQEAADWLNISGLKWDGEQLVYDQPEQAPTQAVLVIAVLLKRYMDMIQGIASPGYTKEQAAVYLGVSVPTIKKYVHETRSLIPVRHGHNLMFTKEMLDIFEKPSWGRPKQVEAE